MHQLATATTAQRKAMLGITDARRQRYRDSASEGEKSDSVGVRSCFVCAPSWQAASQLVLMLLLLLLLWLRRTTRTRRSSIRRSFTSKSGSSTPTRRASSDPAGNICCRPPPLTLYLVSSRLLSSLSCFPARGTPPRATTLVRFVHIAPCSAFAGGRLPDVSEVRDQGRCRHLPE